MWHRLKRWWIDDLFGPRRKSLFMLRIQARILKLRLGLWWHRPKVAVIRHHWPKPAALLFVGVLVPILTGWLLSILFPAEARGFSIAVHNLLTRPDLFRLEWREAAQILLLLVGIPSAFLLWLFRDINVSGTLENQRKDVNLKEFQEIQMRAAGAMDEALPADARETLQIAALHQMRAFLRGEYGRSFRRPAFELLRARMMASTETTGMQEVDKWLHDWRFERKRDSAALLADIETLADRQVEVMFERRRSNVAEAERAIIREEWEAVFQSQMPLTGFAFSTVELCHGELLSGLHLVGCRFVAANLRDIHLENAHLFGADFAFAELSGAHLQGADLRHSYFEGASGWGIHLDRADLSDARLHGARMARASLAYANLRNALLQGADLALARLPGASLFGAHLEAADLGGANLSGADLSGAHLNGASLYLVRAGELASCSGASFDPRTRFYAGSDMLDRKWDDVPEDRKDAARAHWLSRGAVMV